MKMCKTLVAVLLAVVLTVSLCACGEPADNGDATNTTTTTKATTTTTAADSIPEGKVVYKVTVLDEAGAPITGAFVQICKETCIPCPTDANGVATWTVDEDEYKVSFAVAPAGYAVEEAYYFEGDATEMTITLKKG